jgi:hypothetical protein
VTSTSRPIVASRARLVRYGGAVVATLVAVTFDGAAPRDRAVAATPSFPIAVAAGDIAVPAALLLKNDSTAPTTSVTVCNWRPASCPAGDPGITLIPPAGNWATLVCTRWRRSDVFYYPPPLRCQVLRVTHDVAITLIDAVPGGCTTPQPPGVHGVPAVVDMPDRSNR